MASSHGEILEVNYNHATLGSGVFFVVAGETATYDLGGIRAADEENMVTTNGQFIDALSRKRGFFEVVIDVDDNIREDNNIINQLAASPVLAAWTFSFMNGAVYKGTGKPVGDFQPSVNDGKGTLKVAAAFFEKILG